MRPANSWQRDDLGRAVSSLLIGVIETSELESAIGWGALAEPAVSWNAPRSEKIVADIDQLEADLADEWKSFSERLGT